MRILPTGKDGQVGLELARTLPPLGEVVAFSRNELDLTDPAQIVARVREVKPAVIVNAAAYTAVDKAESEPDQAFLVNATAPLSWLKKPKRSARCSFTTRRITSSTARSRTRTRRTMRRIPSPCMERASWPARKQSRVQAVTI
jgi:nucleoside-diphosphate-sugar epimerase